MSDLHIDDFFRDSAYILMHLFRQFPRKNSIYVEDISGPDEPDEVGLHSERFSACLSSMLWLAEENILRYDSMIYQEGIDQAVLSNRAFVILSTPSAIQLNSMDSNNEEQLSNSIQEEKRSLISQIRQAISGGSSYQINLVIRDFLSKYQSSSNITGIKPQD